MRGLTIAFFLSAVACSDDGPSGPAGPSDEPAAPGIEMVMRVSAVSGNGQAGKAGQPLAQPFVVKVTDGNGDPVPFVDVSWSVTSGGGQFPGAEQQINSPSDAYGIATAQFMPTRLGTATASAYVPGEASEPAAFTVDVGVLVIQNGLAWEAEGYWTFFGPRGWDATVPVGTAVEWVNNTASAVSIRSVSVPTGAEPFETHLAEGARFRFVPEVPGSWVWTWETGGLFCQAFCNGSLQMTSVATP